MRDKLVFIGLSIVISLVLFGGAALLEAAHYYRPFSAGFVLGAAAVMISARGVHWKRKAIYVAVTIGVFTVFDALISVTGLRDLTSASLAGTTSGSLLALVSLVCALVPLALPLGMLAAFVGSDPSVLWVPKPERRAHTKKR
jgi:hypothetical protein